MKLGVGERIRLLAILPEQGNLLTIKIVRELRESLSFSEKEHKEYKIALTGNSIRWDEKVKAKEFDIGTKAKEVIVDSLRKLDEEDKLIVNDIPLWDLFIGE